MSNGTMELPQVLCGYVYAHILESGVHPVTLVWYGTADLLPNIVNDYNSWPWAVDQSGTYACADEVPPYVPPPAPPTPSPPTGPLPPLENEPPGGGGNVDQITIIIQLIQELITVMEGCCPGSSGGGGGGGGNAAAVLAVLQAIAGSLKSIAVELKTLPPPNLDPVTCAQLTGLWDNLLSTLNGGTPPVNPTPPTTPDLPAPASFTAAQARAAIDAAELLLPFLSPAIQP